MASYRQITTEDDINRLFDDFKKLRVMIVGDVMVDAYVFGSVDRISPEAPVAVVAVNQRVNRLGGAANVALNIQALGAEPVLVSVIGNDQKGNEMQAMLQNLGMSDKGLVQSNKRITTTKFRVIGNKAQMLRVDDEMIHDISPDEENELLMRIEVLLSEKQVDVIVLQDYNKGVLTAKVISQILARAKKMNIPITVDPKKKHFLEYTGVNLFKPNLKELKEGLAIDFDSNNLDEIKKAIRQLMETLKADKAMVTLSEKGVLIAWRQNQGYQYKHIPAHIRTIADVSGAGDTVISVASVCLALHLKPETTARLSNLAGGLVCEQIGVVAVEKEGFLSEALKFVKQEAKPNF